MLDSLSPRIPIVTIGGFLGAGKTTLINHVLEHSGTQRIVVFVNDFGAINIDYELIETADSNRISLENGCVCCTLNDDLITGIKAFLDDVPKPDAFVVEASGIADPRALDQSIALLEQTGSVRFDNRVYVVDADQFLLAEFEDAETIIDHAAAADLVLLNKQDIAAPDDCKRVEAIFKKSAPNSMVFPTSRCQCPLQLVLYHELSGQRALRGEETRESLTTHHGFVSWSRETRKKLDRSKFEQFLKRLASTSYRAKGRVFFHQPHRAKPCVFHLVGARASLEPVDITDMESISRIVAIGKSNRLYQRQLDQWFEDLVA